jgi:hypothetical protein
VKVVWSCKDWLRPNLQGVYDGLVETNLITGYHPVISCGSTKNTLKIVTESFPTKVENFHTLTLLSSKEDLINKYSDLKPCFFGILFVGFPSQVFSILRIYLSY